MARTAQKAGLLEDLRTTEQDLQRHYQTASDGWQSSELLFARNVVQDAIKYLEGHQP